MNWQVRNPLHCTTDGCTAKAEIEALRARLWNYEHGTAGQCADAAIGAAKEWEKEVEALREKVAALAKERDTLNAALDAKITICGDANLAAMTEECNLGHTLYSQSLDDLAAMTKLWENEYRLRCEAQVRIKELREALDRLGHHEICHETCEVCKLLSTPDDSSTLDRRLQEERERICAALRKVNHFDAASIVSAIRCEGEV